MSRRVDELGVTELTAALRAASSGSFASEAAVELLIEHETWLQRLDFRACISFYEADPDPEFGHGAYAVVDWATLPGQAGRASSSETQMLRIAASLATDRVEVSLRDAIVGLGRANLASVARAVLWAGGYRAASVNLGGAS